MSRGERVLMGIFLIIALAATLLALDFDSPEARDFPVMAGAGTTLIIISYFAISSSEVLTKRMRPFIVDDLFMKMELGAESEPDAKEDRIRLRREQQLIGMLAGFGLVAWLIGLTFAVPGFLVLTMRKFAGESWKTTITVTVSTCTFLFVMFVVILRLKLHFGLLGQ